MIPKIIPVSFDSAWCDPTENVLRMRKVIEREMKSHPDLPVVFVFPELTLHGFVLRKPELSALSGDDKALVAISKTAMEFHCSIVAGGIEENLENPEKPYNALWCWNEQGKVIAHYRKNNLFIQGKPSEKDLYTPGNEISTCEVGGLKTGFAICYDIRFPELFERYKKENVELMILPACWVDGPDKENQLRELSRERAIQTGATFVTVNRAGSDENFSYTGSQYIFDPQGQAKLL